MLRESKIERNVAGKETFIYLDRFLTFELGNWSQSFSSTPPVHILWRVTWSRAVCVHDRHVMLPVFLSSTVATYSSEGKLRTKPTKLNWVQDQPTNLLKWSVRSNFLSALIKLVWFPSLIGPQDSVNPSSNQMQNRNQSRQRLPNFPALHTRHLSSLEFSLILGDIFFFILIGSQPCCRFTGTS